MDQNRNQLNSRIVICEVKTEFAIFVHSVSHILCEVFFQFKMEGHIRSQDGLDYELSQVLLRVAIQVLENLNLFIVLHHLVKKRSMIVLQTGLVIEHEREGVSGFHAVAIVEAG